MEKGTRWYDVSLVSEHDQEPARPLLDVTLQERIRSLLLSRNEKRPPITPSPTPDLLYLSRHSERKSIGNSVGPPRISSFISNSRDKKEESLELLNEAMGATRFDGPAGQFDEGDTIHSRRHSTNTRMQPERLPSAEGRRSSMVSGVNQNTQGDLVGKHLSVSDDLHAARLSTPKRPAGPLSPQMSYTLRTIAPGTAKMNDFQNPASINPESRSLHSEGDQYVTALPPSNDQKDHKHRHGPTISAVDALHGIQSHDSRTGGSLPSPNVMKTQISANQLDNSSRNLTSTVPGQILSGAKLNEILAELPPVVDRCPRVLSVHSNALDTEENANSSAASLIPKVVDDNEEHSSKVSSASRALSILSNISAVSGFRTPHRLSKTKENYSSSENVRQGMTINRRVSSVSKDESGCYRPIVNKRSRLSLRSPNLTTRPSQLKKQAAVAPPKPELGTESADDASVVRIQQQTSESFQKIVVDLESLLHEALDLASRPSRENSTAGATPPHTMRNGYTRLSTTASDDQSSTSSSQDESPTKQGHVHVVEPNDEDLYHGHFHKARDATPFPRSLAATRHQSAVPDETEDSEKEQGTMPIGKSNEVSPTSERHQERFRSTDWSMVQRPTSQAPEPPSIPASLKVPKKEQHSFLMRDHGHSSETNGHTEKSQKGPPHIQPRISSLKKRPLQKPSSNDPAAVISSEESVSTSGPYVADFKNSAVQYHPVYREAMNGDQPARTVKGPEPQETLFSPQRPTHPQSQGQSHSHPTKDEIRKGYSLRGRHHFEIHEPHGFSLSRSHRRAPIARDWGVGRKRFVAAMACVNTALLGLIIGIYAGEVPAIQYAVADEHHVVILGNVVFFLGLAITTALFWPLPLLHGRKSYTMAALTILLPLLFPQALAINASRNPYVATYRVGLLVPRALAGLVMGFANINFVSTLLDLFGASLQSGNPHQEIVDDNDVRRHGGGMGVWLGIWTWCWIGSIGIGFWIGASIISGLNVTWGFWILIILTSTVLLFNVLTPEVRRSAYRRSMAEVRDGTDVSRRIARGEIKMHLYSTGPLWWWEEVWSGHVICIRMLRQPGFAILAFYLGWIYGQVVLVIVVSGKRSPFHLPHIDFVIASRSTTVEVLLLPSAIRWPVNSNHSTRRSSCNTISEGVNIQSITSPQAKDG